MSGANVTGETLQPSLGEHTSERDLRAENLRPKTAAQIRHHLDAYVVGQDEAKEQISFLLSMHQSWVKSETSIHPPPNAIIIGPTGCGKTFTVQVASQYLELPFKVFDVTTFIPSGAANGQTIRDVTEWIDDECERLDKDKAIVFFDEFDKIAVRPDDKNAYWKTDVQRALLKFIESQTVSDLSGLERCVLILAGGAFVGIGEIDNIRKRRPELNQILRRAPRDTIVGEDVVNYGFIPELVARLPAIIQVNPLSEAVLLSILNHPITSPLIVWKEHFQRLGKLLTFSENFNIAVAKRAFSLQMGARGLQQTVFPALSRRAYAFEMSQEKSIHITEAILEFKEEYQA